MTAIAVCMHTYTGAHIYTYTQGHAFTHTHKDAQTHTYTLLSALLIC